MTVLIEASSAEAARSAGAASPFEGELLNLVQNEFPLVERPFAHIGERLGRGENEILAALGDLKGRNIIRQISAIFDTRAMGYKSSLVAARVPAGRLAEAARIINEHPGVSHNYARNHDFNLWFTLAVSPDGATLEETCACLGRLAGTESIRILPTIHLFKIGMTLDMTGKEERTARVAPADAASPPRAPTRPLDELDKKAVLVLQEDLPLVAEPFAAIVPEGITPATLLERAISLREHHYLRRFAAVLYHRKAGFKANGMGVWRVPSDEIEAAGRICATFKSVSHCYQRPTYPDWPYSIFTMVHGSSEAECESILDTIGEALGNPERAVLYSTTEFKKTRVKYFTPEERAWEEKHLRPRRGGCS